MPLFAWASGHNGIPASFPNNPSGSDTVTPERPCSPSVRERDSVNGEYPPACGLSLPAVNTGVNPLVQPELIGKLLDGVASGPESGADHGERSPATVNVPQPWGVASSPLEPPKKCRCRSLNGSCGLSSKTPVICPVLGFGVRSPGILMITPVVGSSITIYPANRLWNGFSFCAAR